jgi:hypothetical protein
MVNSGEVIVYRQILPICDKPFIVVRCIPTVKVRECISGTGTEAERVIVDRTIVGKIVRRAKPIQGRAQACVSQKKTAK